MSTTRTCPRCRAGQRADAPEGLCPTCLLKQAMLKDAPVAGARQGVPMIQFSCTSCGMKLQVKPEFAGRSSRCPTCKKSLVVPAVGRALVQLPNTQIDGTPSSLVQAGIGGGVTLGGAAGSGQVPIQDLLARKGQKGQRYVIEGEIARGGMGAILRAVDCDIRREVAVKYLLDQADRNKKRRFVEEAQITGQLEHPNIVPIHELGVDAQQRLFFAMKMIRGRSLAQILDDLRQHPETAGKAFPLGRLLNIFVSVCHALAYAHSQGVVHRDLKPANIMVGDFGEVYVMDWGLAKVLHADVASGGHELPATPQPGACAGRAPRSPAHLSKVQTSREGEFDLTQEGSIVGTLVYMPPEQAAGRVQAIDQRSDVYALGAILYEMLTLQPAIDRQGGPMAILLRVGQGEIVRPEEQSPQRARSGRIPRELSAVAMKALARDPQDRYPNVEDLRRDIERFQEGRSVSAKEDTKRELLWKFVKRNKAVSVAAVVVAVALMWSSLVNFLARREAEEANTRTRERTAKAVPALVEAARFGVERRKYQLAREQVDLALEYLSDHAEARLLRGQLLILEKRFAQAGTELDKYLQQRPTDSLAQKLRELCGRPRPEEVGNLLSIAHVFEQQKMPALADGLLTQHGGTSFEARGKLLEIYQNRIEAAWKGLGQRLMMDGDGIYKLDLTRCSQVSNLDALEGMPLTVLILHDCNGVRDLSPLKRMPLTVLEIMGTSIQDVSALEGMSLRKLSLSPKPITRGMNVLRGMKTLESISVPGIVTYKPEDFWKRHDSPSPQW